MSDMNFVTFSSKAARWECSARDGSAIAMIVSSVPAGFPEWAVRLARDFCKSESLIIPDSPDGWNIHAEYFDGAHRMFIYLEAVVLARMQIHV